MKKFIRLTAILITGLIVIGAIGMTFTSFGAEKQVKVTVDGKAVTFKDAQPYIDANQRTLVPIAFIAQALGANVVWDADNFKVIIDKGEDIIVLKIGSNKVDVNGNTVTIDTAAALKDSRTFVPLAFISECLGANVQWEAATWTVIITTAGNIPPVVELPEGEVDIKDYVSSEPFDDGRYNLDYWKTKFKFQEVELGNMPNKIKEIRPMSNLANIPNYIVDMGIVVVTEENSTTAMGIIDVEGRYFDLTKTGNKQCSEDFFISKEVEYIVQYVDDNSSNKKAYIAKLSPTIKTGFSGTGEKDNTERKTDSPRAWEKIQATIK